MVVLYAIIWYLKQLARLVVLLVHWIFQSPFYLFYGFWSLIRKVKKLPYRDLESSPVSGAVVFIEGLALISLFYIS